MFKRLLFSIFLICFLNINSFAWGPEYIGIPSDKYMHTVTAWVITDYIENEWGWEWWASLLLINTLGVIKEWSDTQLNGQYDYYDLMANNSGWLGSHITITFKF